LGKEWQENYKDFGGGLLKKFGATDEKMATGNVKGAFKRIGESYTV
jgi:hypothetical protein